MGAINPTAVERLSAGEGVIRRLRAEIAEGTFPVGDRLPSEAKLADRYAVSRPVIREALRSCATLGLTETKTGSGTFVIAAAPATGLHLGEYSSQDLHEARPHIEVPAAELAARRRTDEDVAQLHSLLEAMITETSPRGWVELDGELHIAIARASGNRVFESVIAELRGALTAQSELLNLAAHRQPDSDDEHAEIVRAIEQGRTDLAREAMAKHLERVADAVTDLAASANTDRTHT